MGLSNNWITPLHKQLLDAGYIYGGESCGCNGTPKKRTYHKNDLKLTINMNNRSYIVTDNETKYHEPIENLYKDTTIFPISEN
jgi:hypothetical protein